ncbi:MAG: hypothetical protein AAF682_05140 [Planctomycetota bacterium]
MVGTRQRAAGRRDGFAMVVVLLTLMALLVLCTPFLLTVRNADLASSQMADRSSVQLALDSSGRLAGARLGASHPAVDITPYFDSLDELLVENRFEDPEFLDANDPSGIMFDLDVHDVSGRIDLNSAPPQLIANLIGGAAVTIGTAAPDGDEIRLTTTRGFLPTGFIWAEGELVGYASIEGNALKGLVRSLGVELDAEGSPTACGPRPAAALPGNSVVIDQRAFALALWRTFTSDGQLRRLDAIEQVRDVVSLVMAEELGDDAMAAIQRSTTVYAGVGGGRAWMHGSRIRNELRGGQDCVLQLDDARWLNEGTTVQITDGQTTELAVVASIRGGIRLMDAVANDYAPFSAVVSPLARRPVNINTASAEVLRALLLNLQLRGRQSRITSSEADELVDIIIASRPFASFEDFVRRLILPAAGWETLPPDAPVLPEAFKVEEGLAGAEAAAMTQIIDEDDARALYKNALNANDGELAFATLPFAFVSTDVHQMELRASVNAPSGIERAHAVREQVELVVPQQDLLYFATRQEDFDRAFRLDREAPGWATGPLATARYDTIYRSSPPTRSRAHLGPRDSMPADDPLTDANDYIFASRDEDEDGFAMPWVSRTWEQGRRVGRMLHFDGEQRDLEGRYLPNGTVLRDAADGIVGWAGGSGLMHPVSFSMWIKPEATEQGALFLDAGGPYNDSDRVSLTIDDGDLVLQVRDAGGDHPATVFEEVGEVRYPLAPSDVSPGLPTDTWFHVDVDVRGNRPDQMSLLVDGRWSVDTPGLTRLTGSIGPDSAVLSVESTEGFGNVGDTCVVRIGNELIEAEITGETSFSAFYQSQGTNAGFGGRLARQTFEGVDPGVPSGLFNAVTGSYPDGTPVMHYGYALPLGTNISSGSGSLASNIGGFAVGRVVGTEEPPEGIVVQLNDGFSFTLGTGLDTQKTATLELAPVDATMDQNTLMSAFDPSGGYAVLMTVSPSLRITNAGTGTVSEPVTTASPPFHRIGGVEVIHYSGWSGSQLFLDGRAEDLNLPNLAEAPEDIAGSGAFVFQWSGGITTGNGLSPNSRLTWQTKIFPISLRVSGASSFDAATVQDPKVGQITRLGNEAGLTEWFRYDYNDGTDLIRDDPNALADAWFAVQAGVTVDDGDGTAVPPGGGGGSGGVGGPGGGGGGGEGGGPQPPSGLMISPPTAPPAPEPLDGSFWHYRIGEEEDADYLVTRAVRSYFQFRGVFGTYPHAHNAGTVVLPTFQTPDNGVNLGLPGRFDPIVMVDADVSDPGFPGRVHHAHRPNEYTVYHWQEDPGTELGVTAGAAPSTQAQTAVFSANVHVGLEEAAAVPVAAGTQFETGAPIYDSRLLARITKFPSGERPRGITGVSVGGGYQGGGLVPAATVDEICFGTTDFVMNEDTWGAQMVVSGAFGESELTFEVAPNTLRLALSDIGFQNGQFLSQMPQDAGLLRIGDEIVCYEGYDAGNGVISIAPGGRGMLGTDPQPHVAGEGVGLLMHLPVSVLAGQVGAQDAQIQLTSTEDFPSTGLVLIDNELIHYTWIDGTALGMPNASAEPGAMDGEGTGLFRGRFGTDANGHAAGTPVVLFPFRYWDRWANGADAPELHYMGLSLSQPNAFWQSVFWDIEEPGVAGPRLGVLQRTRADAPWDGDPDTTRGLDELWDGLVGGQGNGIGVQSDRVEWRVFVRYEPGSFDPQFGLSHGWKATPRLKYFGAEYLGPGMVLRRVGR